MTDVFSKGVELKIFISTFGGSHYWFSDKFVAHMVKFCNKHNLHSTLTFEQTEDLILKYISHEKRNSMNNVTFYKLINAVQEVYIQMEETVNKKSGTLEK
jgi:hypothetical protein